MSARTARIHRLFALEKSRIDARERELVTARLAVEAANARAAHANAELTESCTRWLDVESSDDLASASARRESLRVMRDRAIAAQGVAREELAVRERALVAARVAARKMEVLLEGFEEVEAARSRRAERRAADEHAARKTGSGT